jgi:uncharacterized protein (UPF0254 family)
VALQVEKMKEVAKLKAKEERKKLELEVSVGCTCHTNMFFRNFVC